jgi:hypothetical protein
MDQQHSVTRGDRGGNDGAAATQGSPAAGDRISYKFQRLREKLRQAVASGEWSGKLPGERALARRFHVNAKTLSKALTDLAAEGVLERSIGRGTYVKGTAPAQTAQRGWLALCDAGQGDCCLAHRLRQVDPEAQVQVVASAAADLRPSFLNGFAAVLDLAAATPESLLRDLAVRGLPIVAVGREARTYSTHAVLVDVALGAARLARDLVLAGHRRIGAVEASGSSVVSRALRQSAARYAPDAVVEAASPGEAAALLSGDGAVTAIVCDSAATARQMKPLLGRSPAGGSVSLAAVGAACDGSGDTTGPRDDIPCSGYFVPCARVAEAVITLLRDAAAATRPATLWLAGEFVDRGTIHPAGEAPLLGTDPAPFRVTGMMV